MSKFQYHVQIDNLPAEACPEVIEEFDGIRYRAKVTQANSRLFRAQLIEPFKRALYCEIPLFVVGLARYRLVRDGEPTAELYQNLRLKMKEAHRDNMRYAGPDAALEAALGLEGSCIQGLFVETQSLLAPLTAEECDLISRVDRLNRKREKAVTRIRQEIQKAMKEGRIDKDEGRKRLAEDELNQAASSAVGFNDPGGIDFLKEKLAEVRAAIRQLMEKFHTQTGFQLNVVEQYFEKNSCGWDFQGDALLGRHKHVIREEIK